MDANLKRKWLERVSLGQHPIFALGLAALGRKAGVTQAAMIHRNGAPARVEWIEKNIKVDAPRTRSAVTGEYTRLTARNRRTTVTEGGKPKTNRKGRKPK